MNGFVSYKLYVAAMYPIAGACGQPVIKVMPIAGCRLLKQLYSHVIIVDMLSLAYNSCGFAYCSAEAGDSAVVGVNYTDDIAGGELVAVCVDHSFYGRDNCLWFEMRDVAKTALTEVCRELVVFLIAAYVIPLRGKNIVHALVFRVQAEV